MTAFEWPPLKDYVQPLLDEMERQGRQNLIRLPNSGFINFNNFHESANDGLCIHVGPTGPVTYSITVLTTRIFRTWKYDSEPSNQDDVRNAVAWFTQALVEANAFNERVRRVLCDDDRQPRRRDRGRPSGARPGRR